MLWMSKQFYFRFLPNYKYMLIYQLDAWVFTDNLQEWCDKGYDYIGAPFLSIVKKNSPRVIFKGVGNGGLSLRRIQYCIDVLSLPRYLPFITPIKLMKQFKYKITVNDYSFLKVILLFLLYVLKVIGLRNTLHFYIKNINEFIIIIIY